VSNQFDGANEVSNCPMDSGVAIVRGDSSAVQLSTTVGTGSEVVVFRVLHFQLIQVVGTV